MSVIFTVGYENTNIDDFVATLKAARVQVLADIRAVAVSRKKGFSKTALRERLEAEGIGYLHFVDLGDPKPGRDAARSGDFDKFREIYNEHLGKEESKLALQNLAEVVLQEPTCLLCYERKPDDCHRSIVASRLEGLGVETFNLYADDPKRYVRNASRVPRHNSREGLAAAE